MIEMVLFIGIVTIMAGATLLAYRKSSSDAMDYGAVLAIRDVANAVRTKWGTAGNYGALSNTAFVAAGLLPKALRANGSSITYSTIGQLSLDDLDPSGAVDASQFRLTVTSLSPAMCSEIVLTLEGAAYDIRIGGLAVANAVKTLTMATDVQGIQTKCYAGTSTTAYIFTR